MKTLCAVLSLAVASIPVQSADLRPNVVMIIADDMNDYGFLGGFPGVKVPHLDALRRSAITFPLAHCAAPSCVPSRAALFSGLQPSTTGAYLNGSDPWEKPVMRDVVSLPELFRRGGYETWGAGKLFHAPIGKERERAAWDNAPTHGGGFGPFLPDDQQLAGKWWGAGPWSGPDTDFPDVVNADAAIAFLKREHSRPFFLAYGLWRPHTPFTAPQRFFDLYDEAHVPMPPPGWRADDLDDLSDAGRHLAAVWGQRWEATGEENPGLWRRIVWAYLACTSFADWNLGRVIEALDASPVGTNTLVIVFSDNGYHCGEKNHFEKSTLWEMSARIPMAIRMPGRRQGGSVTQATVSLVDLFPTLIDYCGLPNPPQGIDGRTLRPVLEDPGVEWNRPALTCCGEKAATVRDSRYRYIVYPDGSEELYDHQSDPREFDNRAGDAELLPVEERLRRWIPGRFAPSLGGREG